MSVSASMVKELREKTGAGLMDCKKALVNTEGDIEKAVTFLREKGLASASKKSGRATKEGMVSSYIHGGGRIGVMVEINCETDFVARTDAFQEFIKNVAMHVAAVNPTYVNADEVPTDAAEAEKNIYAVQAKESGKPEKVIEKMVEGRYKKWLAEVCLLDQIYVKNNDQTIGDYVKEAIASLGENIIIKRFVRWQLGEDK